MNSRKNWLTGMILAGTLVAAAPAIAGPDKDTQQQKQTVHVTTNEDGKRYEIIITDDDVDARIDGLHLSADRVLREANEIILLDDDGNRIKTITVGPRGGSGSYFVSTGSVKDIEFIGEHPPVMLGVLLGGPGEALQSQLGISEHAILIEKVMDGLPADKAGLEQWDIIIEIEGDEIEDGKMLHHILMESEPGDELEILVLRHSEEVELEIELAAYSAEALGQVKDFEFAPEALNDQEFNWQKFGQEWEENGVDSVKQALAEAMAKLGQGHGNKGDMEQARREIERALAEIEKKGRALAPSRWRFAPGGRLVRPDDDRRSEMAEEMEDRLADLEERFEDRLEELEDRWEDMEEMFDRLFDRLEEALDRRRDRDD